MSNTWSLSNIRQKVRQVTGRFSENELSNEELDRYINQYYVYTFPAEVKLDKKRVYYSFVTEANQAYYDAPETTYTNFEPIATINNLDLDWYQDPNKFKKDNFIQYTFQTPWTGDGTTVTFSTTVSGFPIMPGTLTISDNVELFRDTNTDWSTSDVNLNGSQGGVATINYNSGSISVTFNAAPANEAEIYLNYIKFNAKRPISILYFESKFQLYPVPDQQYIIKMIAFETVSALTEATDTPDLNEWGPAIAYGAARNIFADFGENDAYSQTSVLHQEQISHILTRTCQNLLNTRSDPNF